MQHLKTLILTALLALGTSVTVAQQANAESGVGVGGPGPDTGANWTGGSWAGGAPYSNLDTGASRARASAGIETHARAKVHQHRASSAVKARTKAEY
jgi:hypothetical protein